MFWKFSLDKFTPNTHIHFNYFLLDKISLYLDLVNKITKYTVNLIKFNSSNLYQYTYCDFASECNVFILYKIKELKFRIFQFSNFGGNPFYLTVNGLGNYTYDESYKNLKYKGNENIIHYESNEFKPDICQGTFHLKSDYLDIFYTDGI